MLILVASLFAVAGCLRAHWEAERLAADPIAGRDGAEVEVRGLVLESPRPRSWGCAFRFRAERFEEFPDAPPLDLLVEIRGRTPARSEGRPSKAKAHQGADRGSVEPAAGERWRFSGRLRPSPGPRHPQGFDAGAWLGRQGIHHRLSASASGRLAEPEGWTPRALAWRLRTWLSESLRPHLEPTEHALLAGIMLGESRALPAEAAGHFRRTGTAHLLAASGLNIAVVVGVVLWMGRLFGLGLRVLALPALGAAAFYALLAGASPSVVRAATMAGVGLLALAVGRRTHVLHSLLLAGVALLLAFPFWLFDVGFQLSMAAVAGILAWAAPLERRAGTLPRWVRGSLAVSLSAGLAVAPVLAWHFQEISVTSLLANLLMTPVAEALLPVGLAASVVAGLLPALAAIPAVLVGLALDWLLVTAGLLAAVADPLRVVRPSPAVLGACVLAAVWLRLWLAREGGLRARLALGLASLALLAWACRPVPPSDTLLVRLADLPGGAVAWVRTPAGRELLLLEDVEVLPQAEEMLAVHGVGAADEVLAPPLEGLEEIEPGLLVEGREGWLRLSWCRFGLLWVTGDPPSLPPASVALLPRKAEPSSVLPQVRPDLTLWPGRPPRREWRQAGPWWSTDEHGPLELSTDGQTLDWRRWSR